MAKTTDEKAERTPSAIFEVRLLTNKLQEKKLLELLEAGRKFNNAMLGEASERRKKMKSDPEYQRIIALPKRNEDEKAIRTAAFKVLNKKYGFTDADMQSYGLQYRDALPEFKILGTHVLQKLATRAFRAVQKVAFGKAKKVHFKRFNERISIEGKNNETFIQYRDDTAIIAKMHIRCKIRQNDLYYQHMLKHRIKYCRLVTRKIGTVDKFFLQITFEGFPYQKVQLGTLHTALDIGPSTIATVNKEQATLENFCDELINRSKEIKRLQREAARKLRLGNPQNLDDRGAVKKGAKKWHRSNSWRKLKDKIADLHRRQAYQRKQLHGIMINRIVRQSNKVSTEKLSYKAFQRLYGRSINTRAPAGFETRLQNKMLQLGGQFQHINTYKTKLSQTCLCGEVKKKGRNERWHRCPVCGLFMQRDLFSAYLALFVSRSDNLNLKRANKAYPVYHPRMSDQLLYLKKIKKEQPKKINKTFGL